ncbi:hypothetical protein [Galbibacter sp.]|jgi:hypothetical protein|uniref:hypothetical protein n=1 Tax=Galbibacter sp. TaxID=2918471 RepID=UPI003A907672
MKADDDKTIVSIKYSFLDSTTDKTIQKTEKEHFFVVTDKQKLLSKINAFEASLESRKSPSLFRRFKAYLKHFIESWRYTQRDMLRY